MSAPGTGSSYDVVLLVEQPLTAQDARLVRSLHEEIEKEGEHVRYHLLLPVEDAAARVESAMGSLAASEVLASPALVMDETDLENIQHELLENARQQLSGCLQRLADTGADAVGDIVSIDPRPRASSTARPKPRRATTWASSGTRPASSSPMPTSSVSRCASRCRPGRSRRTPSS